MKRSMLKLRKSLLITLCVTMALMLSSCSTTQSKPIPERPKAYIPPGLLVKAGPLKQIPDDKPVSQKKATGFFIGWIKQYNILKDTHNALIDAVKKLQEAK